MLVNISINVTHDKKSSSTKQKKKKAFKANKLCTESDTWHFKVKELRVIYVFYVFNRKQINRLFLQ